jgi:WD40 repeat protein/predicted Ser/Thr protein kinase
VSEPPGDPVQDLFDQAVNLPAEQRAAFLETACAGEPALRAEVESLLACDSDFAEGAGDDGMLKSPIVRAPGPAASQAGELSVPSSARHPVTLSSSRVGRYRIVRCIAEGGMGAVYEAEQDSPRRTVALKVIRPGFASPDLTKRFTHESQILGRLHHPGIAQVYEAGLADDGQPFFAMEFIRGLPLDEYARLRAPALAARVELLARVCDAVQHAHDQGVIHRDLKPSNILVEESGQPRVLDFGVARVTDADVLTITGRTQAGQLLGTLSYMSPEQVSGDPQALDARSDVYALGVILFELLAHRLPYPLENLPLPEAARVIREQEPSRLGSVNTACRGDIETIVGKALEKDKARRYASAAALAADLRRHLHHEPIAARPPSALYHLRKFARRHKGLVAGILGVFAALLVGTVVSVVFAWRAAENAAVAQQEKSEATYQTYRARLAAAVAALGNHDVADAARHLDAAPKALRGWEWRHLYSRLDDSTAMVRLPGGGRALLLPGREGARVGVFTGTGLRFTDESGNASGERPFPDLSKVWLSVAGSADRWWVASGGFGHVTLRDETGRVLCTIEPRGPAIDPVALSPDRTRLATLLFTNRAGVGVFDTSNGRELGRFVGEPGLLALAFSPDCRRLAIAGDEGVARLLDAATGKEVIRFQGHTSKILSVAFRSDGARLVTASHDGTVRQWDTRSGREVEPPYDRHTAEVAAAVYSPDGERVASGGADRTVRLWRATGRHDQAVLRGHTGAVTALAFSQDGRRLVSGSFDLQNYQGDGTVRFWEATPEVTLPILTGHKTYVYPVACSPDGRWIASGSWDQTIRLWDAATGEACAKLPLPGIIMKMLAFTPDGTRLLSSGLDGLVIWDVSTGRIHGRLPYGKDVVSLAVSPDGTRVAAGLHDPNGRTATIISDLATGKAMAAGEGIPYAFSPDGTRLAGTDPDRKDVVLWDAHTLRPIAHWQGHPHSINAIAFDREGGRLVSASSDRTVCLWDVATGRCLRVFKGHTDEVFTAVIHPDGTRIASAGRDRAVWLWDVASGQEVAQLPGHTSYIWSLTFSPDGKTLVSGSGDRTVRLWDTEPLRVRYQARRKAEALRPKAERLVEQLRRQKHNAAAVVAALRADQALGEPLRQAALRAVLRRERPPEAAPAKPPGPP